MSDYVDLKLKLQDDGTYDLVIGDAGDLMSTQGLDTAVLTSVLSDARATESEVGIALYRGGWLGNLVPIQLETQLGSLLWTLEQRRRSTDNLNLAVDAVQKSLNWLVDNGLAKTVEVSGALIREGAILSVTISSQSGLVDNIYVPLWKATVNGT